MPFTTLAAFGALLATMPGALAQTCVNGTKTGNCNCTGSLGPATIGGNLAVPVGKSCTLGSDVTVGGNVTVESGARLIIEPTTSPVKIGNILTDPGCVVVFIIADLPGTVTISGNVEIDDCIGEAEGNTVTVANSTIGGNVEVNGNGSALV